MRLPGLGAGTVALVTGATGAIGRATAEALVALGCRVGAVSRSAERLEELHSALGDAVLPLPGDVGDPGTGERAVQAILDRWDRLDVLVHLAAVNDGGTTLADVSADLIDQLLATNVRGAFLAAQAASAPMVRQGSGRIVMVASIGARVASPKGSVYGVSKAAVVRLTRQLAVELGPHGITANCVSPGQTPTALLRFDDPPGTVGEPSGAGAVDTIPLRRRGEVVDYVWPILFFASDMCRYVSGTDLAVDGGVTVAR